MRMFVFGVPEPRNWDGPFYADGTLAGWTAEEVVHDVDQATKVQGRASQASARWRTAYRMRFGAGVKRASQALVITDLLDRPSWLTAPRTTSISPRAPPLLRGTLDKPCRHYVLRSILCIMES